MAKIRGAIMRISLLIFILNLSILQAQETRIKPQETDIESPAIYISFLSRGPYFYELFSDTAQYYPTYKDDSDLKDELFYRISFIVEEIYNSLMIEKISRGLQEGDPAQILTKYFYSGFDVGKNLEFGRLTDLKFIKWKSWNMFIIKEDEQFIEITIERNGSLIVKLISNRN